jgi:hypothetical protein
MGAAALAILTRLTDRSHVGDTMGVIHGVGETRDQTLCVPLVGMHVSSLLTSYFFFFFPLRHQDSPLSLEPSATVLHYAQCLFEGFKAYRNKNGKVTLFRPEMNMTRMNRSAERLALPVCLVDEVNVRH